MTASLTPTARSRANLALEFIRKYFRRFGRSPSHSEIGEGVGIEQRRVSGLLDELEEAGEIIRTPGKARGLRLPERLGEVSDDEILLALRARGFVVNEEAIEPPAGKIGAIVAARSGSI